MYARYDGNWSERCGSLVRVTGTSDWSSCVDVVFLEDGMSYHCHMDRLIPISDEEALVWLLARTSAA